MGTSCAAPLWAGFAALVNQQATNTLKPPVGFLNPALYAIGKSPNYALAFHDTTTGNSYSGISPTNYPAVPGFDLCTGWGTPNGTNLINALVPLDSLGIAPGNGFVFSGPAGGSFNPSSQIYFLTNSGVSPLTWSLVNTSAWLNASATSGTLAANSSNNVTMSLTANANTLAIGTYTATVNFSNANTHVVQSLQFVLQALPQLAVAPATGFSAAGLVAGPFNPNSQVFQLTNIGNSSLTWSLINTSLWLNVTTTNGALIAGASTNTAVSLSSTATSLAAGTYTANVWFTNQTKGGAQTRQFQLQVNPVNQSLIQNGGFETGDFTSWTLNGLGGTFNYVTTSGSGTGISQHSGTYFAALGQTGSLASVSQTIPTTANRSYLLSLWFNPGAAADPLNEFSVSWNGNTLFDQVNPPASTGWTNLQYIVTATSSSTVLQFGGRDEPAWLGLDDVSLTPIPAAVFQPTTVAKTNNNMKFAWSALTGLVYQVQFKTNLLQTNWAVLKNVAATNTPVTFVDTNPISSFRQKFYRLLLLP